MKEHLMTLLKTCALALSLSAFSVLPSTSAEIDKRDWFEMLTAMVERKDPLNTTVLFHMVDVNGQFEDLPTELTLDNLNISTHPAGYTCFDAEVSYGTPEGGIDDNFEIATQCQVNGVWLSADQILPDDAVTKIAENTQD